MKTKIIGKIVFKSLKEVSINAPLKVFYSNKLWKLGDYDPDSGMFALYDIKTNERDFADVSDIILYMFQAEINTSNGVIERLYIIDKEILLNLNKYHKYSDMVLLLNPLKMEVTKFRRIDTFNFLEIFKLFTSLSLLFWAVIGYYNLYYTFKEIYQNSSNISFRLLWTYGAVQQSSGTNPRLIFYGILILASTYLLSRIKNLKDNDNYINDLK